MHVSFSYSAKQMRAVIHQPYEVIQLRTLFTIAMCPNRPSKKVGVNIRNFF